MREAVAHLQKADPVLAAIIQRVGPCRIQFRAPEFQTLVRSIVYQQLSGRVALRIFERLLDLTPQRRLTPEAILSLTAEQMRGVGLSAQKALTFAIWPSVPRPVRSTSRRSRASATKR